MLSLSLSLMFKDDLSHLHSLGSFLNELAEVGDVVWHVDNDDLVTGHLWMEGIKRVTRMFEHLHDVGGEDGVDVLQPRGGRVQAGQLRHFHRVVQLAGVPALLPGYIVILFSSGYLGSTLAGISWPALSQT